MKRHFTRAQVEAYCLRIHPSGPDETTTVRSVELADNMPLTLWIVEYERSYKPGTIYALRNRITDVYREEPMGSRMSLWPITGTEVPSGYSSVEEEDQAMKREPQS